MHVIACPYEVVGGASRFVSSSRVFFRRLPNCSARSETVIHPVLSSLAAFSLASSHLICTFNGLAFGCVCVSQQHVPCSDSRQYISIFGYFPNRPERKNTQRKAKKKNESQDFMAHRIFLLARSLTKSETCAAQCCCHCHRQFHTRRPTEKVSHENGRRHCHCTNAQMFVLL